MIRGKKNFLPPCHLILGLGFLFKLEDSSIERHRGERKIRKYEDDSVSVATEDEIEIDCGGDSDAEEISKGIDQKLDIIEEDPNEFPDTHIKFEHATGKIDILKDPKQEQTLLNNEDQGEETVIHAGPIRVKKVEVKFKPQKKNKHAQPQAPTEKNKDGDKIDKNIPKRGQKGKLKKMKEKYKNQDEEDRAMAMELLQSSGSKVGQKSKSDQESEMADIHQKPMPKNLQILEKRNDDTDEVLASDEVDMLDSLTGCPMEEDELLYAIPIVAPYQTLTAYK